jgi:hypothetical protein
MKIIAPFDMQNNFAQILLIDLISINTFFFIIIQESH